MNNFFLNTAKVNCIQKNQKDFMVYIEGFDKKSPIVYSSVFEFDETFKYLQS